MRLRPPSVHLINDKNNITSDDEKNALRQQAETRLAERLQHARHLEARSLAALSAGELSVEAFQRMVHELHVHQIELEMQNEELRRTQLVLDQVRARYFDLYDLAPVGYCTVTDKGLILEANLTAANLLQCNRSVLVKTPLSRFIFKDDQDIYYLTLQRILKKLATPSEDRMHPLLQACELRLKPTGGELVWVQLMFTAVQPADETDATAGELHVFRLILNDISARKRNEQVLLDSEQQLRLALRGGDLALWDWNAVTGQLQVNERWLSMLGLDALTCPTLELWHSLVHVDDMPILEGLMRDIIFNPSGQDFQAEIRARHQAGHWVWLLDKGMVVGRDAQGNPLRIVGTHMDITQQKEHELALIAAKELAETANKSKSDFLARISHELRTPLSAIIGFTQVINMSADEQPIGAHRDELKTILRSGWHLSRIIEDLINLSQIEAQQVVLNIETVDVAACVENCLALMEPLAKDGQVQLNNDVQVDKAVLVIADVFRLEQVLINLLANAIKYNHQGGCVTVSATSAAGCLRLWVVDNGPGIQQEHLSQLFQPFSRLTERAYKIEGAGIGLSVAKQLMQLMGGRIGVESVYGEGCRFWIELPVAENRRIDVGLPTPSMRAEPQSTLLYIEDNTDHIRLLQAVISRLPHLKLVTAQSASVGVDFARALQPDLIILDIGLPDQDGYQVLQTLRSDPLTRDIAVMALSAAANPHEIKKGLQAGFQHYLTKPLNISYFIELLAQLLPVKAVGCRF